MRTKRPTYIMAADMATEVQSSDLRRPRESAAKMRKQPHMTILTTPYTPVAKSPDSVPLRPRFLKIWGA